MIKFAYIFAIHLYHLSIRIASLFNVKAKLWVAGRKDIFQLIQSSIVNHQPAWPADKSSIVWFHCASLGEFEQGRPLIEKLKMKNEKCKIILTFFSPSGYEIRKNYSGADHIFYLPIDTPVNAEKFIDLVKPRAVFFVKYEFWFNYLNELKRRNIPTYLVSGIFRKEQHFFKAYGSWFREQLNCFTHFFLQDDASAELLKNIGYTNVTVAGDTRFDRVSEISKNIKSIPLLGQFKQDKKIMIVGSSWREDEKLIADCRLQVAGYKVIIVPHEIDENHIQSIEALFGAAGTVCLRYSKANEENIKDAQVLIIDNIGMLSSLYQYGTVAFIGGGFGKGIHNILEAATFGLPVLFGPNYQKFTEAKDLVKAGGAFSVRDLTELEKVIQLLEDKEVLKMASHIAKHYVQSKTGATERILNSPSFHGGAGGG